MALTNSRQLRFLGLGALSASVAVYAACSDDSTGSPASTDAGPPVAFDAGGPADSAAPPDAAKEAGAWCGNVDGGALCPEGQWQSKGVDGGASTCKACPATPISCANDFVSVLPDGGAAVAFPTFDTATQKLTIPIPPGRQQIVAVEKAQVAVSLCYGADAGATPSSVPATLANDVITLDLSVIDAGSGQGPCGAISLTVKDACCTTSTVTVNAFWDAEVLKFTNGGCP